MHRSSTGCQGLIAQHVVVPQDREHHGLQHRSLQLSPAVIIINRFLEELDGD